MHEENDVHKILEDAMKFIITEMMKSPQGFINTPMDDPDMEAVFLLLRLKHQHKICNQLQK